MSITFSANQRWWFSFLLNSFKYSGDQMLWSIWIHVLPFMNRQFFNECQSEGNFKQVL